MPTQKQIDSIKTRDQRYFSKSKTLTIPRHLPVSPAWFMLNRSAMQVYGVFWTKRVMEPCQHKAGKSNKDWRIKNNGEIQFTYKEALEKYGISRKQFSKAIKELVEFGFIDVAHQGSGVAGDISLYGLYDRWELYGTPEFVVKRKPKPKYRFGFKKGHKKHL